MRCLYWEGKGKVGGRGEAGVSENALPGNLPL